MGALVLAAVSVVGGAYLLVYPSEMTVFPPTNSEVTLNVRSRPMHVSKRESQISGGVGIFMGLGIGWLAFYRGRN